MNPVEQELESTRAALRTAIAIGETLQERVDEAYRILSAMNVPRTTNVDETLEAINRARAVLANSVSL